MPGAKKLQIFADNSNLKFGWFFLGDSLGLNNIFSCSICKKTIHKYRYKNSLKNESLC
jgi:hypothetical protein